MQYSAADFFQNIEAAKPVRGCLIEGENAYLESEMKSIFRKRGLEIHEIEIKKSGPEPAMEDLSMGGSLFAPSSLLWVKKCSPLSGWSDASFKVWERILARADGVHFTLLLQVPKDKRYKWTDLKLTEKVSFEVSHEERSWWLKRMNARHEALLDSAKLKFLWESDLDLLDLDNRVELWALGGDTWAKQALGYGNSGSISSVSSLKQAWDGNGNPAYAWVDAVLRNERRRSVPLMGHLLAQGEEPLSLLALLGKSVKILAMVEKGFDPKDQPAFLVQKMKQVQSVNRRNYPFRGKELLEKCSELDVLLKSSAVSARALMEAL